MAARIIDTPDIEVRIHVMWEFRSRKLMKTCNYFIDLGQLSLIDSDANMIERHLAGLKMKFDGI